MEAGDELVSTLVQQLTDHLAGGHGVPCDPVLEIHAHKMVAAACAHGDQDLPIEELCEKYLLSTDAA